MHHSGTLGSRPRRHTPRDGRRRPPRGHARGAFVPLLRPARRAGERTASFVALGTIAAIFVVGVAILLLAKVVRPG